MRADVVPWPVQWRVTTSHPYIAVDMLYVIRVMPMGCPLKGFIYHFFVSKKGPRFSLDFERQSTFGVKQNGNLHHLIEA